MASRLIFFVFKIVPLIPGFIKEKRSAVFSVAAKFVVFLDWNVDIKIGVRFIMSLYI